MPVFSGTLHITTAQPGQDALCTDTITQESMETFFPFVLNVSSDGDYVFTVLGEEAEGGIAFQIIRASGGA